MSLFHGFDQDGDGDGEEYRYEGGGEEDDHDDYAGDADELDREEEYVADIEKEEMEALEEEMRKDDASGDNDTDNKNTETKKKSKKRSAAEAATTTAAEPEKKKRKRKARAPRRSKSAALREAIEDCKDEHIDGEQLYREIREAQAEALECLDQMDRVLEQGRAPIKSMRRYKTLIEPLRKLSKESALMAKAADVLEKQLDITASARATCSRVPELYRRLLVRTESFMRSSIVDMARRAPMKLDAAVSAVTTDIISTPKLVGAGSPPPPGSGALVVQKGNELVSAVRAFVRTGENGNERAIELTMEQAPQYRSKDAPTSIMETTIMRKDFSPRFTATCARVNRIDRQRRAASSRLHRELAPALRPSSQQQRLLTAGDSFAQRLIEAAPADH